MKDMPEEIYAWKSGIDGSGDKRWSDDRPENRSDRLINPIKYVRADRPSELRQAGVDGEHPLGQGYVDALADTETADKIDDVLRYAKNAPKGDLYRAEYNKGWNDCLYFVADKMNAQPAAQKPTVDLQNKANLRDKEICTPQTISKQTEGAGEAKFNDVIITEGFPDGWFIQDRLYDNVALLIRKCDPYFNFTNRVCICLRPKAISTKDWLPYARIIAKGFDLVNQEESALASRASVDVPDGWKLVPIEPTRAMYDAGASAMHAEKARLKILWGEVTEQYADTLSILAYRAMLSAAKFPELVGGRE